MVTKSIKCESCGGELDKNNICLYCGSRNIVLKDGKTKLNSSVDSNPFSFTVENINGKIIIKPNHETLNMDVALIRIKKNCNDAINTIICNGNIFCITDEPYQMSTLIVDVSFDEYITNINDINFRGLKNNTKIDVILYPKRKRNNG